MEWTRRGSHPRFIPFGRVPGGAGRGVGRPQGHDGPIPPFQGVDTVKSRWTTTGLLVAVILVLDLWTKSWALQALAGGESRSILGGLVPLNLAFNTGAAFGIGIGDDSRWLFVPLTLFAVLFLGWLIAKAERGDHLRVVSSALVLGGALGNLWDRVRWDRGVVDFLGPVDLGFMLWPIFNVADMAITTGALLLAISLWREDAQAAARAGEDGDQEDLGRDPDNDEVAPGTAPR